MLLRDYQQAMLSRLQDAFRRHRSVMVQMPTGTGKTVLLAEAIRQFLAERKEAGADGGVLIVAHRRELLDQIRATLERYGIAADGKDVTVESVQKLSRAEDNFQLSTFDFQFVIIDEAHHAVAKTYRQLWERWPGAKFLGLTATPCRLSGEPLGELFETLLQSQTIQEFIDEGWLTDFEYVSAAPDSWELQQIHSLRKRGADGDYQTKEMVAVMDVPESIAHLYDTYKEFAWGKKGIVYAIDRQHAQHICAYYRERGVSCEVIDSKTPARERERIVAWYKAPHTAPEEVSIAPCLDDSCTQLPEGKSNVVPSGAEGGTVLVNVDIFSEGFDCPEVEFIQLARPTLSLSKYLQQVGRGMRVSPGKPHVVILDNVGQYHTFGLPTDERDWSLYFSGRLAGKGLAEQTRPVVVEALAGRSSLGGEPSGRAAEEAALVNLRMVRIKRRGERHSGVEVILQNGLYGIMCDGKMTCRPRYKTVRPLTDGGEFFALADYPLSVMGGKTTVIDRQGMDLQMALYGEVKREGDVFIGQNRQGEPCYWDGQGREYYKEMPVFKRCGGVDLKPFMKGRYRLRRWPHLLLHGLRALEVYSNRHIAIIDNQVLVVKTYPQKAYAIFGYRGASSILVKTSRGMMEIGSDGTVGSEMKYVPNDFHVNPFYGDMNLTQVHV